MANGHGGYRQPSNPKAFSGQGKFSERTDGGPMDTQPVRAMPAGGDYGARKASIEQQSAAPMAGATPTPKLPPLTGIFDNTQRESEAVTTGSIAGAGAGPEAMIIPNSAPSLTSTLRRLASVDDSGQIENILNLLSENGIQ